MHLKAIFSRSHDHHILKWSWLDDKFRIVSLHTAIDSYIVVKGGFDEYCIFRFRF